MYGYLQGNESKKHTYVHVTLAVARRLVLI